MGPVLPLTPPSSQWGEGDIYPPAFTSSKPVDQQMQGVILPVGSWNVFTFENNKYMLEHGSNSDSFDVNNEGF